MVDVCVFKSCFRRLEGVNFVALCVFYDHFYPKIWLSGYRTELLQFCHIDSCKDDYVYYKTFLTLD